MNKKDLNPLIQYFKKLHAYECGGFLDVMKEKREAYITRAALLTLMGVDETDIVGGFADQQVPMTVISTILQLLRGYAGFLSQQGKKYLEGNFALHVVGDDPPHDLVLTLLLTTRKRRFLPGMKETVEVIDYGNKL